ncbi:MAG: hypothetical protein AB3N16_07940 [Flavobacteriaceae bacterium]
MKDRWVIKKSRIKEMGIDPNKASGDTTWDELEWLASELDVTVGELIEY